jgi:hypothetical protein
MEGEFPATASLLFPLGRGGDGALSSGLCLRESWSQRGSLSPSGDGVVVVVGVV